MSKKGTRELAREQHLKEMAKQGRCECGLKFSKSNPKLPNNRCLWCNENWIEALTIERIGDQRLA